MTFGGERALRGGAEALHDVHAREAGHLEVRQDDLGPESRRPSRAPRARPRRRSPGTPRPRGSRQRFALVLLVVHDEERRLRLRSRSRREITLRPATRAAKCGRRLPAGRPSRFSAVDAAAVLLDDPLDHREAEPDAAVLRGEVGVEEAREVGLGRARALVRRRRGRGGGPSPSAPPSAASAHTVSAPPWRSMAWMPFWTRFQTEDFRRFASAGDARPRGAGAARRSSRARARRSRRGPTSVRATRAARSVGANVSVSGRPYARKLLMRDARRLISSRSASIRAAVLGGRGRRRAGACRRLRTSRPRESAFRGFLISCARPEARWPISARFSAAARRHLELLPLAQLLRHAVERRRRACPISSSRSTGHGDVEVPLGDARGAVGELRRGAASRCA